MITKHAPAAPSAKSALPAHTIRFGRIKAAVWENEADNKRFYNVTIARTYLGADKKLHDTDSFGRDDLPLVAKVADLAHTFIFERLAAAKADEAAD